VRALERCLTSIAQALKKVLLTGATSFVGGATAARLLSSTDTEIVALVRARSEADGEQHVHDSIARFGVSAPVLLRRLRVLHGGLGAPLGRAAHADFSDVTHVLDAHARTFSAPRKDVRRADPGPAHDCIERSNALPRVERILHVVTAWICRATPPHADHERECPSAMAVADRVASSVVRLLAWPLLGHVRQRLWAGEGGGAFDTSIDACVLPRSAPFGVAR
jgi:NAD(P)-dependent dehydrogenase (short-subunit alcohol dehydrogenase family)